MSVIYIYIIEKFQNMIDTETEDLIEMLLTLLCLVNKGVIGVAMEISLLYI